MEKGQGQGVHAYDPYGSRASYGAYGAYGAAQPSQPAQVFDSLLKTTPLDAPIQKHVARVYTALTSALAASAAGASLQLYTRNALPSWLCTVFTVVALLYFHSLPQATSTPRSRLLAMHAVAAAMGASLGPLLGVALDLAPAVVLFALILTTTVFACFTAAALLAKRRSYLYLGGTLSTCLSVLFWSGLIGRFYPNVFIFNIQLYMGLLVFCGYVIYDTQKIVEKAAAGHRDHVQDALTLFVDFFAIFVRILILLLKNQEKKKKRRN